MLCEEEGDDLQRRIREEDRIRERYNGEPLSRKELHRMAMETDRSEVVYEAKSCAARLEPRPRRRVQYRLSTATNFKDRLGSEEGRGHDQDRERGGRGDRDREKERNKDQSRQQGGAASNQKVENRICDGCGVHGHLRKNFPDRKRDGGEKTPTT